MILSKLSLKQLETLALINYGYKSSTIEILSSEESELLDANKSQAYNTSKIKGLSVDALYFSTNALFHTLLKQHVETITITLLTIIDNDNIYRNHILNYRFTKMYFKKSDVFDNALIDKYYPQPYGLNVKKNIELQKLYDLGLLFYIPLFNQCNNFNSVRSYSMIMMPVIHPKINEYLKFDLLEHFLINDSEVDSKVAMTILKSQKLITDYDIDMSLMDIFDYYKNTDLFRDVIKLIIQKLNTSIELNPVNTIIGLFVTTNIYIYITKFLDMDYEAFKNKAIKSMYTKARKSKNSLVDVKMKLGLHVEEYLANVLNNEQHRDLYGTDVNYFNNLKRNYVYTL
jgi:hypothetical protein